MKWQERILEIREGSWSYVAGSIGVAPGMLLRLGFLDNDYNLSTCFKVDLYFLSNTKLRLSLLSETLCVLQMPTRQTSFLFVLCHQIFECFNYVEKVVGKAAPKEESEDRKASWYLSTGDELTIQWDSSASAAGFSFDLTNPASCNSSVMCWSSILI